MSQSHRCHMGMSDLVQMLHTCNSTAEKMNNTSKEALYNSSKMFIHLIQKLVLLVENKDDKGHFC